MIPTPQNRAKLQAKKEEERKSIKKISNTFIESAIHNSSYHALKVVFFLSSVLEKIDLSDEFLTVRLNYEDALKFTGIGDKEFTRTLRAMQEVSITFINEEEEWEEYVNLLPSIRRLYGKKQVEIKLFSKVARLIVDVPKNIGGTILNVKDICKLKSKHSIRLLPILHMINGFTPPTLKQKKYELHELNAIFGTKNRSLYELESRILKEVQHELNTTSKIGFIYELNTGYHGIAKGRPKALSITIIPVVKKYVQRELI
jgi:hypothetical protein